MSSRAARVLKQHPGAGRRAEDIGDEARERSDDDIVRRPEKRGRQHEEA
jgi:hypothetical protein